MSTQADALMAIILASSEYDLPAAEVTADTNPPGGDVDIDWDVDKGKILSVSVSKSGRLGYAFLLPDSKGHGSYEWDGTVPQKFHDIWKELAK